jgi:hypothetical protein
VLFNIFRVSARKRKNKRISNSEYLQKSLALQTRALQLKREKLKLEARKVAGKETIVTQLSTIQTLFFFVYGIGSDACPEQ